jgi:arylsulfatase A-like enzyme
VRNAGAVQAFVLLAWLADLGVAASSGTRWFTPHVFLASLGLFLAAGWIALGLTRRDHRAIALLVLAGGALLWTFRFSRSRPTVRVAAATVVLLVAAAFLRIRPRLSLLLVPWLVLGYQLAKGGAAVSGGVVVAAVLTAIVALLAPLRATAAAKPFTVACGAAALAGVIALAAWSGRAFASVTRDASPHVRANGGPNIILVVVDTLRADRLGVYGYRARATSPFLDRFARGAVVYRNAYATSSWTVPSMATMFTGLQPEQHGVMTYGLRLPRRVPLLAERLRMRGYTTTAVVANYLVDDEGGFARGFDRFAMLSRITAQRGGTSLMFSDALLSFGGITVKPPARSVVDETLQAIAAAPRGRPLFAYMHLLDPHHPIDPPRSAATRAWRAGASDATFDAEWSLGYDREVRTVDDELARFIAAADRLLGRGTVIAIVADHGEELGERGLRGHGNNLDEAVIRVPLLVRRGGATGEVTEPFSLASLAGLLESGALKSHAVRAHLIPPPSPGVTFRAVLRDGWKLITVDEDGRRREQLYRLPDELHDQAASQPAITAALRAERDALPLPAAPAIDDEARAKLRALGYLH